MASADRVRTIADDTDNKNSALRIRQQRLMNPGQHPEPETESTRAGAALLNACLQSIEQCLEVINGLPAAVYRYSSTDTSSIGIHTRHIIERIQCVLEGVSCGTVNYDIRARNQDLETSSASAEQALLEICARLAALEPEPEQELQIVESVHQDHAAVTVASTLDRELMGLVSHTIHHLAIIALLARSRGIRIGADIGKAPSTLIHERSIAPASRAGQGAVK
jgi:hypothetical protein